MFTTADNYVLQIHRPLNDPLLSMVVASALIIDTALKQDSRGLGEADVIKAARCRVGILLFRRRRGTRRRRALGGLSAPGRNDTRTRPRSWRSVRYAGRCAGQRAALIAERGLRDVGRLDVLVHPGGLAPARLMKDIRASRLAAHRCAHEVPLLTSVCTGALVFAAAGLLAGRPATSHWSTLDLLAED
jgi:transcriptional regulator GlxA family with amidase domain